MEVRGKDTTFRVLERARRAGATGTKSALLRKMSNLAGIMGRAGRMAKGAPGTSTCRAEATGNRIVR
jgi:hypothetical protein